MSETRGKKWLCRCLVSFVVLGIATAMFAYYHRSRYQQELLHLNSRSMLVPGSFSQNVPKTEDALIVYEQAIACANEFNRDILRNEDGQLRTDGHAIQHFQDLKERNAEFFSQIDDAHKLPGISFRRPSSEQRPSALDFITIGNILNADAILASARNDHRTASLNAIRLLGIANKLDKHPSLMNALAGGFLRNNAYRVVYDLIVSERLPIGDVAHIESELVSVRPMQTYVESLKMERYLAIEQIEKDTSLQSWFFKSFAGKRYLDKMSRIIAIASDDLTAAVHPRPYDLIDVLLQYAGEVDSEPTYLKIRTRFGERFAKCNAMKLILKMYSSGISIDSWSIENAVDLGAIEDALTDPFSGMNMKISYDGEVLRVYSVGPNGIDDGGRPDSDDIGLFPGFN